MDAAFSPRRCHAVPPPPAPAHGAAYDLPEGADRWLEERVVTSVLVMQDGALRYEEYFLGTGPDDRRISWSVAKSYLSALLGVLLEEGAIASIDDPVTKYAPLLKGSAYDGASIRNVLNMASGVTFDEDYLDTTPTSNGWAAWWPSAARWMISPPLSPNGSRTPARPGNMSRSTPM